MKIFQKALEEIKKNKKTSVKTTAEPKPKNNSETATPNEPKTTEEHLKRQIHIPIPKEAVQLAFQKSYRDIGKNVRITGFRPGKAPAEAIRQTHHYNKIRENALYLLLEEFYGKVIQAKKLNPAGEPKILNLHLKENQAGSIKLELEVHPQFTVKNYKHLKVKKRDTEVTQQQIDSTLEKLKHDWTRYEPAKTKCFNQEGLVGIFSITATYKKGNKKFLPLCLKKCAIQMGKTNIALGFDKNLENLQIDQQKTFDFSFPKDHRNKELAGRTLCFQVKLQKIERQVNFPLNDEFARKLSYKTFKDLKEDIKKKLKEQNEKIAEEELRNAIVLELAKQNPLVLPEVLVEKEKTSLLEKFAKEFAVYNLSPESIKAALKERQKDIEESAKTNVHISYLLQALARDLQIEINNQMLEEYLQSLSSSLSLQQIQSRMKDQNFRQNISSQLAVKKTIDYLMKQAEIV